MVDWVNQVGPGWRCLVWPLVKRCELEGVEIHQVKEKYGGLRFYVAFSDDSLDAAITDAEDLSETICEDCGEPGKLRQGSWLRTLCEDCYGQA